MRDTRLVIILLFLGYESIGKPFMVHPNYDFQNWGKAATTSTGISDKAVKPSSLPPITARPELQFSKDRVSRPAVGSNPITSTGFSAEFHSPVQPTINPSGTSHELEKMMYQSKGMFSATKPTKPELYYTTGHWNRLDQNNVAFGESLADRVSQVIEDEGLNSRLRYLLSNHGVPNKFETRINYEAEIRAKAEEILKEMGNPEISLKEKNTMFLVLDRISLAQEAFGASLLSLMKKNEDYREALIGYLYTTHEMSKPRYSWTLHSLRSASMSRRRAGFIFGMMNDLELREAFDRKFLVTKFTARDQSGKLETVLKAFKNLPNKWYEFSVAEQATRLKEQIQDAAFDLIQQKSLSADQMYIMDQNIHAAYEILRHLGYYEKSSFLSIFRKLQKTKNSNPQRMQMWISALQQNRFYAEESMLVQNLNVQGDIFVNLPVETK